MIAVDHGTDDNISYAWNTTDMTVTIHGGNDMVTTGFGNDVIFDDAAQPWPGMTTIGFNASSGDDVIHAGAGNDTIYTGDGHNTYDGGDGIDTVNYSRATVSGNVDLGAGTGKGNGTDTLISIENVIGSNQDDVITGSSVANILEGGQGNDQLYGGDGNDTLVGGLGNDLLLGGKGADSIRGGDGIDTVSYGDSSAGVTIDLLHNVGHGGDAEGDTITTVENVIGSSFNDILIGDDRDNVLAGIGGQDKLIGGLGHDTFQFFGRFFSGQPTFTLDHPDIIADFTQGEDLIDLSHLNTGYYEATHEFVDHLTGSANEVMAVTGTNSTMVYVDLDGDKAADYAIQLATPVHVNASNFVL